MNAVLDKFFSLLERLNITTHEFYLANKLADLDNQDLNFLGLEIINFFEELLKSIMLDMKENQNQGTNQANWISIKMK